jgi:hypothetical protein
MPATYDKIAAYTVPTAQSSYTFTSVPSTYTDLVAIINGGVTSGQPAVWMRFNSDSGSNYSFTRLTGNGTSALSSRESNQTQANVASYAGMNTTLNTNIIVQIMNYANTTTNKTIISRANLATDGLEAGVNLWRSTAAITNIQFLNSSGTNFAVGTTFTLYGIKSA